MLYSSTGIVQCDALKYKFRQEKGKKDGASGSMKLKVVEIEGETSLLFFRTCPQVVSYQNSGEYQVTFF